jgi:NADH-quinone oxidoreductase subunit J
VNAAVLVAVAGDASIGQQIAFWATAIVMAASAVRVVTSKNVVHAALYLVITLAGVAAIYAQLTAEFVAWVQVLIYIGAVIVLLLFGVMLTRATIGREALDNEQRFVGLLAALALFGVTAGGMIDFFGDAKITFAGQPLGRTAVIGEQLFTRWVIPFEVVSIILLASLVGAVALARKDDARKPGSALQERPRPPRVGAPR